MRVKRYVVDSMPDALQKIRSDLGKDAVILNTKEIRSGGFLGLFSKKKIEVIAATDSSANSPAARSKAAEASKPSAGSLMQVIQAAQAQVAVMEGSREEAEASSRQLQSQPLATIARNQAQAAYKPQQANAGVTNKASEAAPLQTSTRESATQIEEKPQAVQVLKRESDGNDELLKELRAMKQMVAKLTSGSSGVILMTNPILEEIQERMLDQEISSELTERIIRSVEEEFLSSELEITREAARLAVSDQLRIILGANTSKALASDTRIAHFVGPTGVGKTTTIAKLAAEQTLKYRRKVGMITSDTYRIAAVDQLKTYATILNVPLEVVFSPLDLKKAFDQFQDCDIVFMDTAGRNFRNEMYVSELNALLQSGGKSETYLVMSLTTKYKDMKAITENFNRFKLDKVLFTKMDETDTYGSIVNLKNDFPIQLSYITNGQNVPDDFAIADENEITDLIMGEQSDE